MDQRKIGFFLKELRKEKNLTQEQLAEKINVSGRTVSRWEMGHNMSDISLLVEPDAHCGNHCIFCRSNIKTLSDRNFGNLIQ